MIKNVIIVNDFDYIQGGASKVAIQTADILSKQGINVIFFSAVSKEKNDNKLIKYVSTNQNEALKEKNKLKGMINGIYNFKAKKDFKNLLNLYSSEDTVINIHGWTKALSSSVFSVAFKKNFKVYLTLHDYFTACPNGGYFNYVDNRICPLKGMSVKCICTNCDSRNYMFKVYRIIRQFVQNNIVKLNKKIKYVIGISDFSIEVLKKSLNKNVIIKKIHNPIDLTENTKISNIENNMFYTYVGRISKEKGVDLLCKSLEKDLLVIGDGPELEKLKSTYKKATFPGWKESKEINEYLLQSKILILPSLWYEGAPLVPLEAMNLGIPCIISNKCAGSEYINGKNGLTYDPYIENDLKEKIKVIEEKIDEYSENAYLFAKQWREENYYQNIMNYFEE